MIRMAHVATVGSSRVNGLAAIHSELVASNLLRDSPNWSPEQDSAAWLDQDQWTTMSILNSARSGFFSSDRSIREYCFSG